MYYQVRGPPEAKGDEWWWPLVRRGISENSSEKAAGDAQWKPSGRRLGILQDRRTDEEKAQLLMTFEQWRDRRASLRGGADLRLPKPWAQQVEDEVKSGAARGKPATECTVNGELNQKVALVHGGVLDVTLDAIVNAANTGCLGGGGVDYAVHRGAGELLVVECASFNGCSTGQTRLTKGYNLPSDFVLHTVGPMDEDARALKSCYLTCLELAEEHQLTSLGFCMVSTGIFGYPLGAACHVALKTTRDWLEAHPTSCITCVAFCCYLDREYDCYRRLLPVYFPTTHDTYNPWTSNIRTHSPKTYNLKTYNLKTYNPKL
eukprot:gene9236-14315_t